MTTDRDYACAIVIDTHGRLLLQQRDDFAGIASPEKIRLFGGDLEDDETFLQCVVREINEEIGCHIPPERFEYLCGQRTTARGEYYVVRGVPAEAVTVTEGSLVLAEIADIPSLAPGLVPTAYEAIKFSCLSDHARLNERMAKFREARGAQ